MVKKVIEVKGIKREYKMGDLIVPILKGIDMFVNKGEFVAITGPSGCGKSTLLNQIGVIDTPTAGKVIIDGVDTSKLNWKQLTDLRLRKMGFIFQFFNLVPELNVIENVMLPMQLMNIPKEQRIKKAKELLELVELSDRLKNMPSQISGGQMQRVSIARALANNPKIIIADEPTGNLDQKTTKNVVKLFKEILSEGNHAMVMVTHDKDISRKADRRIKVIDGLIVKR